MRLAFVLLALAGVTALGAEAPDRIVSLPPFLVEETDRGPPWRYCELPGFEVLARCSDAATRNVIQAYYRLHQMLGLVLPEDLRLKLSEPCGVIMYDEDLQAGTSKEVMAQMLRSADAKQRFDENAPDLGRGLRAGRATPRVSFLPNLRLNDKDSVFVFTIVRENSLQTDTLYLTSDYVAFMLRNRVPALPLWFVAGFLSAYHDMTFRDDEITLKPLTWISDAQTAAVKKDPKTAIAPMPLGEFFRGSALLREDASRAAAQHWAAQAALFVRWGLDDKHPERHAALWRFAARVSESYASEKLFQECFGCDYATAQPQLAEFLPAAVRRTIYYELDRATKPPPVNLRDATPGEIARLKGEWERLEIAYVKNLLPEFAPKYLEQARRTLRHAYDRDDRDPRLLAALGLCASDAGDEVPAREFLEAAARDRGRALRPRASFELARLRYADALAHPASAGGRLNANQAANILTPLFSARQQLPPLPEVYRLIAEVWAHSEFPPSRAHLSVLDEGVALFPRDSELVYQTASLLHAHGWDGDARSYVELGIQAATNDATRTRFTQLQSHLAAAAPR